MQMAVSIMPEGIWITMPILAAMRGRLPRGQVVIFHITRDILFYTIHFDVLQGHGTHAVMLEKQAGSTMKREHNTSFHVRFRSSKESYMSGIHSDPMSVRVPIFARSDHRKEKSGAQLSLLGSQISIFYADWPFFH